MPVLSVTATTATTASFAITGLAADGVLQWQIAVKPDFKFCVCPIFESANASPYTAVGLNQATTYYARARSKRASGDFEDWSETIGFRTPLNVAQNTAPQSVMIQPTKLIVPAHIIKWQDDSGSPLAAYPVSNLGVDSPVAWRSPKVASYWAFRAAMAPQPIDHVALLNTNLAEDSTVQVFGSNTNGSGYVLLYDGPFRASPNLSGRPGYHGLIDLGASYIYPHWILQIFGSVPGGMLHVEHAIFGKNRQSKNHSLDKVETPLDLGSLERNRNGNPQRIRGLRMRRVDFDISVMTEAQYETLYADLGTVVGTTDPVLVAPNSKGGAFLHDRLLYGAITGGRATNPASPRYTRSFTIDSLI